MQIILLERIENLGQMGEVVNVKSGFARNYLLPQKKARRATKENLASFEEQRTQLEAANLEQRGEAQGIGEKLNGLMVTLIRQAGESGQLYGSVNTRDLSEAVTEAGFTIGRDQIRLDKVIKTLGLHPVKVTLHPEVTVTITANVARTEVEASTQAKTGHLVSPEEQRMAEDAAAVEAAAALAAIEAEEAEKAEETSGADLDSPAEEAPEQTAGSAKVS